MPRRKATVFVSPGSNVMRQERASAGIFIIAGDIAKISGFYAQRIAISAVFAEKGGFVSTIGIRFGTGEAEETFGYIFPVHLLVGGSASRFP